MRSTNRSISNFRIGPIEVLSFMLALYSIFNIYHIVYEFQQNAPKTNTEKKKITLEKKFSVEDNLGGSETKNLANTEPVIPDITEQNQPRTLTAYLEHPNLDELEKSPLPVRNISANDLEKVEFPQLKACSKLPEQWPVLPELNSVLDKDPFLPWIHDVFPSHDGKFIHFVAQNKRRCNTGKRMGKVKEAMQPQVALFQHVPIKRIKEGSSTRYKLTSHEEADEDGVETRFICRFKPSMQETLSTYQFNYDYHSLRKGYKATFTKEGFDNHIIWTSQLLFNCPVPAELQEIIKNGSTVFNDYASLYVDLIPIRTMPRYGYPVEFLPPRFEKPNQLNATHMWGNNHILPLIEDSGRWENIPICKTSLETFEVDKEPTNIKHVEYRSLSMEPNADIIPRPAHKVHNLIGCTWASTSFETRGGKATVSDGERRLREWLTFHLMAGFDHIYVYDNSGAFSETNSLKAITDQFPGRVTRINWPIKVCNNTPNNRDNKGERSSQYAAESSCKLRFGTHSKWLGQFDTDEYLIPTGENLNIVDLLEGTEKQENTKILSFKSQRSNPRSDMVEKPEIKEGMNMRNKFIPIVPEELTFLQSYNCQREKPRVKTMPAEKQIYQPDYVLLHHIHYSTITTISQLSKTQTKSVAKHEWNHRYKERHMRFIDEDKEGLMIHTKTLNDQTMDWISECQDIGCRIGYPWPNGVMSQNDTKDKDGFLYNCFIEDKVENYWVPKLIDELSKISNV